MIPKPRRSTLRACGATGTQGELRFDRKRPRPPMVRAWVGDEIHVDNFAGGGGAGTGLHAAGFAPSIAINHSAEALAMYRMNHPTTELHCESVWDVDPVEVTRGRPVGLAWFSPDCTHFSKSKGSKPLDHKIRGLAWSATMWAAAVRPRVIMLENVEEFVTWGPLHRDHSDGCRGQWRSHTPGCAGAKRDDRERCKSVCRYLSCRVKKCHHLRPIAARAGQTFRAFVSRLESYGYVVEWRLLRACDYGAPTTRRRLFLVARCDGLPVIWPAATHGPRLALPFRPAAEIIDWSIPCRSIFGREKPLKPKTEARIARGIRKFVLESARPFIVPLNRGGYDAAGEPRRDLRVHSVDDPMPTITGGSRGAHAVILPLITKFRQNGDGTDIAAPLDTVMAGATTHALVAPYLVHRSNGERVGQAPRIYDPLKPLGTVVAGGNKHVVCEAHLESAERVAAWIQKHHNGHATTGQSLDRPLDTLLATNTKSLTVAHLLKLQGGEESHLTSSSSSLDDPAPTITAGGWKLAQVEAFLVKYNSNGDAEPVDEPLSTLTTKPRYGLVTVTIDGEEFVIVDIGMRMLTPRELFSAQGFPPGYRIDIPGPDGDQLSKTAQIRLAGNSVPPPLSEVLARANMGTRAAPERRTA